MEIVITALGPDNTGLADPIIHLLTTSGARIEEIQMYDHDEEQLFAMLCRAELDGAKMGLLSERLPQIAGETGLAIRLWSPELRAERPRLAVCTTFLEATPRAVLEAVREGTIPAEVAVVIGNRRKCEKLAAEFGIPFECIGDDRGAADDGRMVELLDQYEIDYVVLARYMRILPASTCWQFAGGRIINLHHGLLPGFPGFRP